MNLTYPLLAVAIGVVFAAQPVINGVAGRVLGSPIAAAFISVAITLAACLVVLIALRAAPSPQAVMTLPWWVVLGGGIGVLVVAGGAAIAPVTGATIFFVCLIAGQLVGAMLLDHFGAFGTAVKEISLTRGLGVMLALAGVILVQWK